MKPIAYVIPGFLVLIALEWWVARRRGLSVYRLNDSLTSINVGLMSEFAKALGAVLSVVMYALISERFGAFTWDSRHPMTWVTALLLYDFCYYWVHRTGHEINVLWASHVVHHSSEEFNLSTALRQSSTGFLFRWIFYIPLALLGFPLQVFVIVGLVDFLYQYWVHTQLIGRLGWLEYVVVTPSNHRVHHGQNDYCLDKNYGGIFSFWDRMFGTYADERDEEKPVYGVRKPLQSWNPLWANLHQFALIWRQVRAAKQWRVKLMHVFGKPGWSPAPVDAPPAFSARAFERFETDLPRQLRQAALGVTAAGALLLMVFFALQPSLPLPVRIAYCVAMILVLAGIGWAMTRAHTEGAVQMAKVNLHD